MKYIKIYEFARFVDTDISVPCPFYLWGLFIVLNTSKVDKGDLGLIIFDSRII